MEGVKKQADHITELESELAKAHKQERAYEEAMEQLQADLDTLEQDNAKLKAAASTVESKGTSLYARFFTVWFVRSFVRVMLIHNLRVAPTAGTQPVEHENVPVEGSLETSYLLEQIEALRGTVRFLRTENSFLKGQDLLKDLEALPALPEPVSRLPTPPLVPSGHSDSEEEDEEPPTPPTLRTLAAESKLLYRDVIKYTSSPRVVDLSVLKKKRAESASGGVDGADGGEEKSAAGAAGTRAWLPRKKTPAYQVWERKQEGERLGRRVQALLERTNSLAQTRR